MYRIPEITAETPTITKTEMVRATDPAVLQTVQTIRTPEDLQTASTTTAMITTITTTTAETTIQQIMR